jgi:hypothetical protein
LDFLLLPPSLNRRFWPIPAVEVPFIMAWLYASGSRPKLDEVVVVGADGRGVGTETGGLLGFGDW